MMHPNHYRCREATEFHRLANEARVLAAGFSDRQTLADLQGFAAEMDRAGDEIDGAKASSTVSRLRKAS